MGFHPIGSPYSCAAQDSDELAATSAIAGSLLLTRCALFPMTAEGKRLGRKESVEADKLTAAQARVWTRCRDISQEQEFQLHEVAWCASCDFQEFCRAKAKGPRPGHRAKSQASRFRLRMAVMADSPPIRSARNSSNPSTGDSLKENRQSPAPSLPRSQRASPLRR